MSETLRRRTLDFHEMPEWIADNKYLKTGYRSQGKGCRDYVYSLFHFHNETCNIWIHLVGALFFLMISFYIGSIFAPGQTVHPHLTDISHPSFLVKKIESTRLELETVLSSTNHTSSLGDAIHEKFNSIEESLTEYYHKVSSQIEDQAGSLLQNIRRNSQFLLKKLKEVRIGLPGDDSHVSHLLSKSQDFLENCLRRLKLSSLLHMEAHNLEHYPLYIFLIGAVSCLGFSTMFHLFHPINPTVAKILHKLDYAGISLLNFGSSFAAFFYYFYCENLQFWFATTFIFIGCFGTFIVSLTDWIDLPEHTTFKGLMYGFLGISNVLPALFILRMIYRASEENDHIPLGIDFFLLLMMGATYLFGLVFYILKIPERWVPYKFDIWCNSHAIWHFFVFLAAAEHFVSLIFLYGQRQNIHCLQC